MNDLEQYMRKFRLEKDQVARTLAKGWYFENDGDVDPEIRELVLMLNDLPFAYTTASCSGHLRIKNPGELKPNDWVRYFPGYVDVVLSPEGKSQQFKRELESIVANHTGASIEERYPIIETYDPELQGLDFEVHLSERPPRATKRPMPPNLKYEEALKRNEIRLGMIKEISALAEKYLR